MIRRHIAGPGVLFYSSDMRYSIVIAFCLLLWGMWSGAAWAVELETLPGGEAMVEIDTDFEDLRYSIPHELGVSVAGRVNGHLTNMREKFFQMRFYYQRLHDCLNDPGPHDCRLMLSRIKAVAASFRPILDDLKELLSSYSDLVDLIINIYDNLAIIQNDMDEILVERQIM